jgi:hypothetical protein
MRRRTIRGRVSNAESREVRIFQNFFGPFQSGFQEILGLPSLAICQVAHSVLVEENEDQG